MTRPGLRNIGLLKELSCECERGREALPGAGMISGLSAGKKSALMVSNVVSQRRDGVGIARESDESLSCLRFCRAQEIVNLPLRSSETIWREVCRVHAPSGSRMTTKASAHHDGLRRFLPCWTCECRTLKTQTTNRRGEGEANCAGHDLRARFTRSRSKFRAICSIEQRVGARTR